MTKYHKRLTKFVITAMAGLCGSIGLIILNFTNLFPTSTLIQHIPLYATMAYIAYFIVEEISDFVKPFI